MFQIVTLPVEFNASARAKRLVVEQGIVPARSGRDRPGAQRGGPDLRRGRGVDPADPALLPVSRRPARRGSRDAASTSTSSTTWTQGPASSCRPEPARKLRPEGDGLQQHALPPRRVQAMNLAFADRDFYYGDPGFPPEEPIRGLLSKITQASAHAHRADAATTRDIRPGDPIRSRADESVHRPAEKLVAKRPRTTRMSAHPGFPTRISRPLPRGTTSISRGRQGWLVYFVTPSGGLDSGGDCRAGPAWG